MKKILCIFLFVILFTGNLFAQIDNANRKLNIYLRSVVNDYQVETFYPNQLGILATAYTSDVESSYSTPSPTADALTDNSGGSDTPDNTIGEIADISVAGGNDPTDAQINTAVNAVVDDVANAIEEIADVVNELLTDHAALPSLTDVNALRVAYENLRGDYEALRRPGHDVTNVWQGVPVIPLSDNDEIHFAYMIPHNANTKYPMYLRWILLPNNGTSASTIVTTIDKVSTTRTWEGGTTVADGATVLDTVIPAIIAGETVVSQVFASDWGKINGSATLFDVLFLTMLSTSNSSADRLRVVALQIATKRMKRAGHYQ